VLVLVAASTKDVVEEVAARFSMLVVPKGNPAGVRTPDDLLRPAVKRLALGGPTVPAGIYARQALKRLGLWERAEGRVVSGENVRVALSYVERGEADAGIVYATEQTIPLYIYSQVNSPGGMEDSARLVVASVLIAAAALTISEYLERRGRAAQMRRRVST
jgi:molybdenum ABC transporter molybdate-binding protein